MKITRLHEALAFFINNKVVTSHNFEKFTQLRNISATVCRLRKLGFVIKTEFPKGKRFFGCCFYVYAPQQHAEGTEAYSMIRELSLAGLIVSEQNQSDELSQAELRAIDKKCAESGGSVTATRDAQGDLIDMMDKENLSKIPVAPEPITPTLSDKDVDKIARLILEELAILIDWFNKQAAKRESSGAKNFWFGYVAGGLVVFVVLAYLK